VCVTVVQLFLRFDGVFHHAQVFLNGEVSIVARSTTAAAWFGDLSSHHDNVAPCSHAMAEKGVR